MNARQSIIGKDDVVENTTVMDAIAMNSLSAGLATYKFRNNNGLCTF